MKYQLLLMNIVDIMHIYIKRKFYKNSLPGIVKIY